MRGQLSLEFLLVFAIFLALLLVSLSAISKIREVEEQQIAKRFANLMLADIANAVDEVCILGDGNSRNVRGEIGEFELELVGKRELELRVKGGSTRKSIMCDAELLNGSFSGGAFVENEKGKIYVS